MATLLAPYNESMRLGSGFNSFTQELRVDHAVVSSDDPNEKITPEIIPPDQVAQTVTYSTKVLDKASDVTDNLNIAAAFQIKYDTKVDAGGKGEFINSNKIKESDLSFMISVKVVNKTQMDTSLTKLAPIPGMKPANFTDAYGDCFISGFQEGGEFTAIISVKVKDRDQVNSIVADAKINLSLDKIAGSADGRLEKAKNDFLKENETSVMVSYIGGGQGLKKPEEDWDFNTMRAAALRFPELCAKTPMRTSAILTKYTSLRSFFTLGAQFSPLDYENASTYTSGLQDAYLEYKEISKKIHLLAFDVINGKQTLTAREGGIEKEFGKNAAKASTPALLPTAPGSVPVKPAGSAGDAATKSTPAAADASAASATDATAAAATTDSTAATDATAAPAKETQQVDATTEGTPAPAITTTTDTSSTVQPITTKDAPPPHPKATPPLVIDKPYPPTVFGLEAARVQCRFQMNRIVAEVDLVASHPDIAIDETRPLPYMSPFMFSYLLPIGTPVTPAITTVNS